MADLKRRKLADSDAPLLASLESDLGEFHTFSSGGGIEWDPAPAPGSSVNSWC